MPLMDARRALYSQVGGVPSTGRVARKIDSRSPLPQTLLDRLVLGRTLDAIHQHVRAPTDLGNQAALASRALWMRSDRITRRTDEPLSGARAGNGDHSIPTQLARSATGNAW